MNQPWNFDNANRHWEIWRRDNPSPDFFPIDIVQEPLEEWGQSLANIDTTVQAIMELFDAEVDLPESDRPEVRKLFLFLEAIVARLELVLCGENIDPKILEAAGTWRGVYGRYRDGLREHMRSLGIVLQAKTASES